MQAKDINLIALGDVTLTGVQNKQVFGGGNDTTTVTTTQSLDLKADNVNIQGVGQNSDVTLVAANFDAANKAKIAGTGDVTIASAENRTTHEWTTTTKDCNWYGKCTTTVTHGVEDKTTQVGSDVKGATVEITAGKDLTTVASTIEGGDVSLSAQGKIDYLAALNVDKKEVQGKSSSSWLGIDTGWLSVLNPSTFGLLGSNKSESKDTVIQTRAATTSLQSEGDILSQSGGDTKLQGTQVKAQNFTVNAGVVPGVDPNAKIIIEGVKETLQTSHTQKSESLVWQSMSGNGMTEETLKLAQINAKTKFSAPGGIDVQLPAGDPLKQQVQSLSQQPGMAWLNDLSQRKDVNWQEIKLAKDSWSYDQQGLTPAGAAILAIAIAAYTGGMGAELLGGTAATSTSAATLMGSTVYGAAANAGFAALASSAGVSFVNNGGDIGKTLKDMGSSQNVKGVLTAMATAGVLNALGSTPTATGQTGANAQAISTTQAVDKFAANLMQNVTNNMASAVVSSAINGTPLNEDTLSTALTSALITAGMAQAANSIGAATQNGTLNAYTQAMAHALAGCVGGAATTGNSGGCSAGAVGAVVGELSAGYAKSTGATDANALAFARSMSAVAGALVGGPDGAAAVNVAAQMGANAAANNRLLHQNESALANKLASNSGGKYTQQQIEDEMRRGSNTAKGETAASNMILDPSADKALGNNPTDPVASTNFDKGAVFNNVGGSVVQVDRDGTSLGSKPGDTGLQAYIQANTGGADSPYKWVTPLPPDPVDPNASIKMTVSPGWSYGGANSAGLSSGFKPDTRTQAEVDKSLNDTTKAIAILPVAVGAAVVAPEAALIGGGVNLGAQLIKGEGVSPTEVLVSTTMGPIGAAATEAQAVKALIEQGGKTAITTNASIGAGTNVVGDTTTKVLTGQEVTATGAVTAMGTGAAGANVVSSSKVIPSIATEGLNAVVPIIENVFSNKQGN